MKTLFDTSLIVASLVEAHPMHPIAFPWLKKAKEKDIELIIAGHTVSELYAVLSTLPREPRISPAVAWRLIHENIEAVGKIVSLSATEYSSVIKKISEMALTGGITYDALIAKVAEKSRVEQLLTLNSDHFKRVWPEGKK